jgi:hypothetical protein
VPCCGEGPVSEPVDDSLSHRSIAVAIVSIVLARSTCDG